jgi:hypothetical protein
MRRNPGSIDVTPDTRYARIRTAGWLMRLLDKRVPLNSSLFDCAVWCLGGLDSFLDGLIDEAENYTPVSMVEDELETMREMKRLSGYSQTNSLEEFLEAHPRHSKPARLILQDECRSAHAVKMKRPRSYRMAAERLKDLFGLDQDSVELCEFLFINRTFGQVESYFEDSLEVMKFGGTDFLAYMLDIPGSRCRSILRELSYLGIAETSRSCVVL